MTNREVGSVGPEPIRPPEPKPMEKMLKPELLVHAQGLEAELAELRAERDELREQVRSLTSRVEALENAGSTEDEPTRRQKVAALLPRRSEKTVLNNDESDKSNDSEKKPKGRFARLGKVALAGLTAGALFVGASSLFGNDNDTERAADSRNTAGQTATGSTSSLKEDPFKTIKEMFAVPTAQAAPTAKPESTPPTKTEKTAREKMLDNAEAAKTVAGGVSRMHSTDKNIDSNVHAIFDEQGRNKLDHRHGAMNNVGNVVNKLGELNGTEALAYAFKGSPAYAQASWNVAHGKSVESSRPSGVSAQEVRDSLERTLTAKGTKIAIEQPTGTFLNHGQRGEDVFPAGILNLQGNQDVLTVRTEAGKVLRYKVWKDARGVICINLLTPITIKTPPTPNTPPPVTTPQEQTPNGGGDTTTPQKPKTQKPKPQGGGTTTQPQKKVTPKVNTDTTPGGVDGEPTGRPTHVEEDTRPAATVDPAGHGQAQQQAPAPLETSGPAPNGPAVEGPGATTAPAEPAHGNETPAPQQPTTPIAGS